MKWTYVTDELPTEDRTYLCLVKTSKYMQGLQLVGFDPRSIPVGLNPWLTKREVIAWMWIPNNEEEVNDPVD